jgi:hypothetical protein
MRTADSLLHPFSRAVGCLLVAAVPFVAHAGVVVQVAAGSAFTCALLASGRVKCWGDNSLGQLGNGSTVSSTTPVDVEGLPLDIVSIAAGGRHACALTGVGGVACWGANAFGQLGDGTYAEHHSASRVLGLSSGASAIATGNSHSCALAAGGAVECWGGNGAGQLGDGTATSHGTPAAVPSLASGVVAISAGFESSAAIATDGRVKYWGRDGVAPNCSQTSPLGPVVCVNVPAYSKFPKDAASLPGGIAAVSVVSAYGAPYTNDYTTCVIAGGGRVVCGVGLLGPGQTTEFPDLASGVTAISMGGDHTCVLTPGGVAQCWGANNHGQLGDGTTDARRSSPKPVAGLSDWLLEVVAGGAHSCALTPTRDVMCWGANDSGQVGDGTTADRTLPVIVNGLGEPNYQGLWWNAPAGSEPGWGINLNHQDTTIFATWFTYGVDGKPTWFVVRADTIATARNVFTGDLYTGTGPPFSTAGPGNVSQTKVGTATFTFTDTGAATFAYVVNGIAQQKQIVREQFAAPMPTCTFGEQTNLAQATNYQDLWWNADANERWWGVNLAHQGATIFLTWFTFGGDGKALWMVAALQATSAGANVYTGTVYKPISGPPFNTPFDPALLSSSSAGTATLTFADGNKATFAYDVDGVAQSKDITREVFAPPGTVCR